MLVYELPCVCGRRWRRVRRVECVERAGRPWARLHRPRPSRARTVHDPHITIPLGLLAAAPQVSEPRYRFLVLLHLLSVLNCFYLSSQLVRRFLLVFRSWCRPVSSIRVIFKATRT